MKPQIATNKEQSTRLLSCGVDPMTADMCIITYPNGNQQAYVGQVTINAGTIYTDGVLQAENVDLKGEPAWSLSRLIMLLPMSIEKDDGCYRLNLEASPHEEDCYKWCLSYYEKEWEVSLCYNEAPTPIEACVQMIEWLKNNGCPLNKVEV